MLVPCSFSLPSERDGLRNCWDLIAYNIHFHLERFEKSMRWFGVIGVGLTLEMDWVASIFIFVSCKIKSRLWVGVCIWEEKGMFLKLTQRMEIEMMIFIFSLSRWFLALTWISSYFVFPFSLSLSSPCFLHLEERVRAMRVMRWMESDLMQVPWSLHLVLIGGSKR